MPTFESTDHVSEEMASAMLSDPDIGFISIAEPSRDPKVNNRKVRLDDGWASVLRLWFHDIDCQRDGYTLFSPTQADELIRWLKKHENKLRGVMVHCAQGVSRSAAVARFIAKAYGLPFNENKGALFNRFVFNMLCLRWSALGFGEINNEIYVPSSVAHDLATLRFTE